MGELLNFGRVVYFYMIKCYLRVNSLILYNVYVNNKHPIVVGTIKI